MCVHLPSWGPVKFIFFLLSLYVNNYFFFKFLPLPLRRRNSETICCPYKFKPNLSASALILLMFLMTPSLCINYGYLSLWLLQDVERSEFSEEERQLSRRLINYWTSFIRHGYTITLSPSTHTLYPSIPLPSAPYPCTPSPRTPSTYTHKA
jgi:hypothetical protein